MASSHKDYIKKGTLRKQIEVNVVIKEKSGSASPLPQEACFQSLLFTAKHAENAEKT
jgi:hypothetical protein